MIRIFRHHGLKRLYERGDRSLIRPDLQERVEVMLAQLDVASSPEAMPFPTTDFMHSKVIEKVIGR